jgi:hypothetical protein
VSVFDFDLAAILTSSNAALQNTAGFHLEPSVRYANFVMENGVLEVTVR